MIAIIAILLYFAVVAWFWLSAMDDIERLGEHHYSRKTQILLLPVLLGWLLPLWSLALG